MNQSKLYLIQVQAFEKEKDQIVFEKCHYFSNLKKLVEVMNAVLVQSDPEFKLKYSTIYRSLQMRNAYLKKFIKDENLSIQLKINLSILNPLASQITLS